MSGPQLLRALERACVEDLWIIGVGTKLAWCDFVSLYEGSIDDTSRVTLDLGRTRLYPNHDYLELFRVGGGGGNEVRIQTWEHGTVHCRTYALCGTDHGTLHYSKSVRNGCSTAST